jgi:hypothetical protein
LIHRELVDCSVSKLWKKECQGSILRLFPVPNNVTLQPVSNGMCEFITLRVLHSQEILPSSFLNPSHTILILYGHHGRSWCVSFSLISRTCPILTKRSGRNTYNHSQPHSRSPFSTEEDPGGVFHTRCRIHTSSLPDTKRSLLKTSDPCYLSMVQDSVSQHRIGD